MSAALRLALWPTQSAARARLPEVFWFILPFLPSLPASGNNRGRYGGNDDGHRANDGWTKQNYGAAHFVH
jgi:hypothetical protein